MANTIQIKRKTTTGAPSVGSLSDGEFCLVTPDDTAFLRIDGTSLLQLGNVVQAGSPIATHIAVWDSDKVLGGSSALIYVVAGSTATMTSSADVLKLTSAAGSDYLEIDNDNGRVTASGEMHAVTFHGDGSALTGVTASADLKPYCVTGSGTDLTTTEATMAFSTEVISDANYSLATNQITVTAAGTYQISFTVVVTEDGTAGGAREASKFHMEIGTTKIPQSEIANYNRETSADSGASTTFLVELSASDVLQLRGIMMGTPTDVSQGASQISITKIA